MCYKTGQFYLLPTRAFPRAHFQERVPPLPVLSFILQQSVTLLSKFTHKRKVAS